MRRIFDFRPHEDSARRLYAGIVAQSRRPEFFLACGVPDTLDGRFDVMVLHVFLVLHRLKRDRAQTADLSQALFDVFFQDMDENLRQMGAGDMGVGRRIKAMAEGFYGRTLAYEQALDEGASALDGCVRRNLYAGGAGAGREQVRALALYIEEQAAALAGQDLRRLMRGEVEFGRVPQLPAEDGAGGQMR